MKGSDRVDQLLDMLAVALVCILGLTVFAQFATRYLLNDSLAWTEEVARYLLIVTAYAASAVAVRRAQHVALSAIYARVPRESVKPLVLLAGLASTAYFVALGAFMARLAWLSEQRMVSLDVPRWPMYAFVAVMLLVAAAYSLGAVYSQMQCDTRSLLTRLEGEYDPEGDA